MRAPSGLKPSPSSIRPWHGKVVRPSTRRMVSATCATRRKTVAASPQNPQRPLSKDEVEKRAVLAGYLDTASEDELIDEILLPLFRHMGFRRITAAGHKDKALEYGKDVWMKFTLRTLHHLYFGVQAKRDKLDAASKTRNENIAEVLAQIRMM